YWHFATKEDLLLGAIDELHQRYVAEFAEALTPERRALPAREQLARFFGQTTDFIRKNQEYGIFFGVLAAGSADTSPRIAGAIRQSVGVYVKTLGGIIRHGQKTGEFRADLDADTCAHALIASH